MKGLDIGDLMKQAQKMTRQMNKVQEALKEKIVEGAAGGGMVKAFVNGNQEVVGLKIDPAAVDPGDVDMLQDTVTAALNIALKKSKDLAQAEMSKATGGNLPAGLLGL